jgi:hypothetical protein
MGFEILLIPLSLFGGIGLVALVVPVAIARGRSWWSLPLFGGVAYSAYQAIANANDGWKWLSVFATLGILYLIMAFLLVIAALLLLPFKSRIAALLMRATSVH